MLIFRFSKLSWDFFWNDNQNHNKMHLINWANMTLPKEEGGFGIRDLKTVKKAIYVKHITPILNSYNVL